MNKSLEIYKICLSINLIGESELLIKLIHVDPMVVTSTSDILNYHIFRNVENNFCIWSLGDFAIVKNGLKIPQKDKINNNMRSSYKFNTDNDRLSYLKNLYKSLQKWSCDKRIFNEITSSPKCNNIAVNYHLWFVY